MPMIESLGLPNYPPLDVVTDPAELAQYIDKVASCEIPAFTVSKELGRAMLLNSFKNNDWVETPTSVSNARPVGGYSKEFEKMIPSDLRDLISYPHSFHLDANDDGLFGPVLRAHFCRTTYRAILATSVQLAPDLEEEIIDVNEQQIKLWSGVIDKKVWKDVRLHQGQAEQAMIFRSLGPHPVAHDFQTDRNPSRWKRRHNSSPWKRKFDVLEFQRAADVGTVSLLV